MRYVSTRGNLSPIGFIDAVLMGMADDGGLLVPETVPIIPAKTLRAWRDLSYPDLAVAVLAPFIGDEITAVDLQGLIRESYGTFRDQAVTPLRRLDDRHFVLELFHGPTFAFKDVALQFLGNLYGYVSEKTGATIHILGATSGDTGASAIAGVQGKPGIRIGILYPHGKVSRVQELQMTTVQDENVLTLAVEGSFDDCQRIVKALFGEVTFKRRYHLRAINSINIARILAQVVYYFAAYLACLRAGVRGPVNFSVPTGNFGDIFAGYLAKRMGLPVDRLILATNENDILQRFQATGVYQPESVRTTYSPAMDIQVASNFERYLYYLCGENPEPVAALMAELQRTGQIVVGGEALSTVQSDFSAYRVGNDECLDAIAACASRHRYLVDPHTACAVRAAETVGPPDKPTVILATAHPAKFAEAMRLRNLSVDLPPEIRALFGKPESRRRVVEATREAVERELVRFLS